MIYIVDAHSYDKNGIPLRASAMSLSLKERGSTATITLDDREGIKVTDILKQWFRDDADPGKNMMWRATKLTDNWSTNTPSLQLEHVINTLKDSIVFGKVGPAEITGNSEATTCSAKATIEWLLKKQVTKDWKLGNFDVDDENQAYNFESDTIYDAIETVCSTLTGVWWEYDTKKYPFTLHIRKHVDTGSNKDPAETMLRCARNIRTISRSVDKSSMYTRFYPIGSEDLHLKDSKNNNVPYVDQNTDKYGIIEHVETDNTITTNSKLKSWAKDELRIHARKIETIEVEGLELSAATGEPMDKIRLGKMCQIVVNTDAVSTDMTYRIIQLSYPDKISKPEVCKITLSNKRDDLPKMVAEAKKKAAKSGRVAARKEKETKQIILNTVKTVRISGPVDNVYTLQYQLVKDTDWQNANPGTFSRAVTSWEVGASKGTITVTAKPQGQKKEVKVRGGSATRNNMVYTGQIQYSGDGKAWANTGATYTVNAKEVYDSVTVTKVALADNYAPLGNTAGDIRYQIYIQGTASNGKKKNDTLFQLGVSKYANNTKWGVTLSQKDESTGQYNVVIGRIDASTVYIDGQNSVTVTKVALADNYSPLGNTAGDTRYQIYIQGTASNGAKKDNDLFQMGISKYAGDTKWGVTLSQKDQTTGLYNVVIGRVDATAVYNDGRDSVTVTKVALADNYSPLGDSAGDTRYQIYIQGTASNGAKKDDTLFQLGIAKYAGDTKWGAKLSQMDPATGQYSVVIGRIDLSSVWTDGKNSVTVSKVALADNYSPLGDTAADTRYQIYIQGTASNGSDKRDDMFQLSVAKYANNSKNGVSLSQRDPGTGLYNVVIGRINVDSVWTDGRDSVTVDTVESRTGELGPTETKSGITVRATASNNARKDQHYSLVNHKIDGTNYAEIQEGQQDAIVVARIATVNYSGQQVLYYDSQEYTQGRFITHYHTDNSTNVKITTTNKTVYYS